MDNGKALFQLYNKDGGVTLAHRLQHLFNPVVTEADKALHNDISREVMLIIDRKERNFLQEVVDAVLYKREKRKPRFLLRVAKRILLIGQMSKGK